MDTNLEKLREINPILAKLVDGNSLTTKEAKHAFTNTFLYDLDGIHSTALMVALHTKGETSDELLGLCQTYEKLATKLDPHIDTNKAIDLSGTGGGSFKTINVSTAASFVVAAAGYIVPKASYFGITSPTGSADIFAAFGIDISKFNKELIEKTLEQVGICPFYTPYFSPKLANRAKVSRKIFGELQLRVRTPFHLATNTFSPINIKHRLYGCYSEKYLEVLATLFSKLGFKRSLTVYAQIGMPEMSNVGKTIIVEQNGKKIKRYEVTPKDLGVKEAKAEDIKTGGKEQNILDFKRILKGEETGPKADLVAVNAGAAFYALEAVGTIKEGTSKAKEILSNGKAYSKLKELKRETVQVT